MLVQTIKGVKRNSFIFSSMSLFIGFQDTLLDQNVSDLARIPLSGGRRNNILINFWYIPNHSAKEWMTEESFFFALIERGAFLLFSLPDWPNRVAFFRIMTLSYDALIGFQKDMELYPV
jgi:hypothetical protein